MTLTGHCHCHCHSRLQQRDFVVLLRAASGRQLPVLAQHHYARGRWRIVGAHLVGVAGLSGNGDDGVVAALWNWPLRTGIRFAGG